VNDALHLWMNVTVVLMIFGVATFLSCLSSTTWRD